MGRLITAALLVLVTVSGAARAADTLEDEQLKAQFLLQLPGYWTLSAFNVEASANYGTEVEPIIRSRFNAVVELGADTFALQEQEGTITWLTPIAHAGETRTVYGLSTATRAAGAWEIDFALENNPMPRLGQPRDFFSGRTIVRGGDEEAAYLEELGQPRLVEEELRHKEEVARRQRELELEELDHQAELARLRHQEELEAAEQEAAARAAEAEREAAEAALAELAERARTQLAFDLPGYWRLADFELREAKTEEGDLVQAFTATIELASATFVESEREGPVVVVTPVAAAGERRELVGHVRWTREGETWSGAFTFENNPMEGLGRPLDFFEGRVLIAGSEEDAAWRAAQHAEEIARLEREEAVRAKEREAELAALAHREQVDEAERARAEAEAAARKAEMEALIAGITEELRARFAIGVPGHWRLESFEVQEHAWRDEGESELELGFAAELRLATDTFAEAERDGQVLFVTPVASAGDGRTIYAAGAATRTDDGWQYEIEPHNKPALSLGLPIDYFEGRVLVQGSEEAEAYAEQRHKEELARLRRAEELREQERQAALAEQRHEQLLEEERQKVELARVAFDEKLVEEHEVRAEREEERARQRTEQRLATLFEAMASSDAATRGSAIEAALSSNDVRLRERGLRHLLENATNLSVQFLPKDNNERGTVRTIQPLSLNIARFDVDTGNVAGVFIDGMGALTRASRDFSGRIAGDSFSVAGPLCQVDMRLREDRVLHGTVRCTGRQAIDALIAL